MEGSTGEHGELPNHVREVVRGLQIRVHRGADDPERSTSPPHYKVPGIPTRAFLPSNTADALNLAIESAWETGFDEAADQASAVYEAVLFTGADSLEMAKEELEAVHVLSEEGNAAIAAIFEGAYNAVGETLRRAGLDPQETLRTVEEAVEADVSAAVRTSGQGLRAREAPAQGSSAVTEEDLRQLLAGFRELLEHAQAQQRAARGVVTYDRLVQFAIMVLSAMLVYLAAFPPVTAPTSERPRTPPTSSTRPLASSAGSPSDLQAPDDERR